MVCCNAMVQWYTECCSFHSELEFFFETPREAVVARNDCLVASEDVLRS